MDIFFKEWWDSGREDPEEFASLVQQYADVVRMLEREAAGRQSRSDGGLESMDIEALAHREAWRYKKSSDPHHSDTYTFNRSTLLEFARKLIAAEREACKLDCRALIPPFEQTRHGTTDFEDGVLAAVEAIAMRSNVEVTGDGRLHGRRPSEPQG